MPDGAKFCGQCGTPLLARCEACGTVAGQAGQRFCLECGSQLPGAVAGGTAVPAPAVPAASVERRQVSVLFADLTGFTSFSERRDAEDVREMLSEYFDSSRRIIDSYGGRVEKFIGDAVMALWGAPVAHEVTLSAPSAPGLTWSPRSPRSATRWGCSFASAWGS